MSVNAGSRLTDDELWAAYYEAACTIWPDRGPEERRSPKRIRALRAVADAAARAERVVVSLDRVERWLTYTGSEIVADLRELGIQVED